VRHAIFVEGCKMKRPTPPKAESSAPNTRNFTGITPRGKQNYNHCRTMTREGEPFPLLVVRTTQTEEQLELEAVDLAMRGITRIVFHSQEKMDLWLKRLDALDEQQNLIDAALVAIRDAVKP
jgi:hypothetical protein